MDSTRSSGSAEHPIQNKYTFWYMRRGHRGSAAESWEDSIKQLGTFNTVESFWSIYNHIVRPNDVTGSTELHLFKHGIKPMWEDENNARGGKWSVRLKKGLASHFWEELVMAIIGEQFDVGNEICGAVVSVRSSEDIISVWNRNADNADALNKIHDHMRRLFKLPNQITIDYKRHDNSGFAGHRPRRNSSVGSEADGNAPGTSVSSGGSGGGGFSGKWRSRRIMQQRARGSDEPAAEPAPQAGMPSWMTTGARERPARGSRGEPQHRERGDARETGTGWGTRGAGFERSRREGGGGSGWGERGPRGGTGGDSGGRGEAGAAAGGGGGSTFWRHAAGADTNGGGGRGGFSDSARRGGGSAWRSDNRWRDADANPGAPAGLGDAPPS